MVNTDNAMEKLKNGLFVGLGVFSSQFIGDKMAETMPGGQVAVGAGQLAVGAGVSVAADEMISDRSSVPNDVVEHAGYGIQGAAWAELADTMSSGSTSGGVTEVDVTRVQRNRSNGQQTSPSTGEEISVDV